MAAQILFVHNKPTPFVSLDQTLLRERWSVQEWYQPGRSVNLLALGQAVRDCQLVVGWFASWHTFWPAVFARLLHKPMVMIVGGYDVANLPGIDYGHQRGGIKRWMSRWIVRNATTLVTHSVYSCGEIGRNIGADLLGKTQVIHLGIADGQPTFNLRTREQLVLTVGNVDRSNLYRKGHHLFVQAASRLPDVRFVLAGRWLDGAINALRAEASPNVHFTNWLDPQELDEYLQVASVYVQASAHESFGLAVAEAMVAGCIPVVTQAGSLPEVVGNEGVYAEPDPRSLAQAIRLALACSSDQRQAARDRILSQFPVSKRRDALWACVEQALTHAN